MKEKLFIEAFKKIQTQTGAKTKNKLVNHMSNALLKCNVTGISDRNLTRYFDKYIEGKDDAINPKIELLDAISQEILNLENYESFVIKNSTTPETDKSNKNIGGRVINQYGSKSLYIENNSAPIKIS